MVRKFLVSRILWLMPKRALTALVGWFCHTRTSALCIPLFAYFYKIPLDQAQYPHRHYTSLTAFFSRRLKPSLRVMPIDERVVVSPVDGVVSSIGTIQEGLLVQVKGVEFTVKELLNQAMHDDGFEGGMYVILYLSPQDYHRIHAPLTSVVVNQMRIGGTLFPVNRLGLYAIDSLYTKNERVVFSMVQDTYCFSLIAVGSTLVGSVKLSQKFEGKPDIGVLRGEELGWFEFGSTVILLFEKGQVALSLQKGQRVEALQQIGTW